MKKVKIVSCLALSIIAIVIILINDHSSATIAIENNALVMKVDCQGRQKTLQAWYNEEEDIYSFFLPAYMKEVREIEVEGEEGTFSAEEEIYFAGNHIKIYHSSNLPAVFVNTETGNNSQLDEDKEIKEAGAVEIVNSGGELLFNNEIEYITGRGNSTWYFEKKPYTLKLKDSASLCGMNPGKKWVLLANTYEATKISYKMAFDLAQKMGLEYTPEAEWVDLYMNGEYKGNYLLCKAIYAGSGSVDISGVIFEKVPDYEYFQEQGFSVNDDWTFSVRDQKNITEEEMASIPEYMEFIDELVRAGNQSYVDYLDQDSMIKRFLVDEITYNSDTGITSTFFYKEKGNEQLMSGPIWDYDGSFGESNGEWLNYDGTVLDIKDSDRGQIYIDWNDLLYENDEEYYNKVVSEYKNIEPYLQYLLKDGIDEYADYISDSVRMDMIRWDYGKDTAGHYSTFDNNVRFLKFFLSKRVTLLNERWGLEPPRELSLGNGAIHTVRFVLDDKVYEEKVADGDFPESIPKGEEVQWYYSRDELPYSEYLPILEDITLVGKYKE